MPDDRTDRALEDGAAPCPTGSRRELGAGAFVVLVRQFIPPAEADVLFETLRETLAWQQGSVRFFGREVPEPRLTAWFGDRAYTYSGRTLPVTSWPDVLRDLRARVEHAAGQPLNTILLNRYRDGRDSMGFHSDDEPELGPEPVVASVSLGATRRFVLKPKSRTAGNSVELELEHGSLLVMGGTCQRTFRHAVPKQRHVSGERISLTFRHVLGAPAVCP